MCALSSESISRAKTTQILILLNVIIFILGEFIDGNTSFAVFFAQEKGKIMDGEVWRLLTSIFIHWDLNHLINNMIGLLLYGSLLETRLGRSQFILIYLIAGLMGSIFSFILPPLTPCPVTFCYSAGASGAIFGLMGVSFIVLSKETGRIYLYGLIYIIYSVVVSFQPNIGVWAHIFGLIAGLLYGFIYYLRGRKYNRYNYRY
jgi:rhomboid protease GluP